MFYYVLFLPSNRFKHAGFLEVNVPSSNDGEGILHLKKLIMSDWYIIFCLVTSTPVNL